MTTKDRLALAAYMEMLDDTVDLRNDSVGMDGGDPVRLLLAEHDRIAAELRRLRISQLRRMADIAEGRRSRWAEIAWHGENAEDKIWCRWNAPRMGRFYKACLAEIERLRALS